MTKQERKAYEQGRRDEAETTLENLYIILEEMKIPGALRENAYIYQCIRDLEEYLGKREEQKHD